MLSRFSAGQWFDIWQREPRGFTESQNFSAANVSIDLNTAQKGSLWYGPFERDQYFFESLTDVFLQSK